MPLPLSPQLTLMIIPQTVHCLLLMSNLVIIILQLHLLVSLCCQNLLFGLLKQLQLTPKLVSFLLGGRNNMIFLFEDLLGGRFIVPNLVLVTRLCLAQLLFQRVDLTV